MGRRGYRGTGMRHRRAIVRSAGACPPLQMQSPLRPPMPPFFPLLVTPRQAARGVPAMCEAHTLFLPHVSRGPRTKPHARATFGYVIVSLRTPATCELGVAACRLYILSWCSACYTLRPCAPCSGPDRDTGGVAAPDTGR